MGRRRPAKAPSRWDFNGNCSKGLDGFPIEQEDITVLHVGNLSRDSTASLTGSAL